MKKVDKVSTCSYHPSLYLTLNVTHSSKVDRRQTRDFCMSTYFKDDP